MAKAKSIRHVWAEEEMRSLIEKIEQQRPSGIAVGKWIEQQGLTQSGYRSMKKRYLVRFGQPQAAPVVALAKPEAPSAVAFRDAPKGIKRQMLVEYNNLPDKAKAQWRDEHNVTQALASYYNRRLFKNDSSRKGSHPAKKHENSELAALVQEYASLEVPGAKGAWLKARGLNHQNIHDWKKKLGLFANGHAALPAVRVTDATYSHVPHHAAPTPTLQDGVNYLSVKRDLYTEIIEDLQRVLRGAR